MWQNGLISKKNHHWRDVAIKVWVSMPFLGLSGGLRSGKRVCILERKCGFPCPFWACRGGLRRGKRACILEQECGFLCPFWASWGRPRRGKRGTISRFQDGDEENCCLIEPPAGGSDWAALMEGFSWFQRVLRPMLGPCWATKIPNAKRKVLGIYVWAFWGASFESQQKGFPVGIDFGASWPCSGLYWAILGRQGDRRGSNKGLFLVSEGFQALACFRKGWKEGSKERWLGCLGG